MGRTFLGLREGIFLEHSHPMAVTVVDHGAFDKVRERSEKEKDSQFRSRARFDRHLGPDQEKRRYLR